MAQHDYNIANNQGLAFRSDLNDMASAIVTQNSGATEPTTTYAGMFWLDTSGATPVLKQRNQANDGWNTLSSLIDAEVMPSPTAGGYVKRKSDNTGNETKTAQQVADELAPLFNLASPVPPATTSTAGIVELATDAEANAGASTSLAVTPSGLEAAVHGSLCIYTGTSANNTVFPVGSYVILSTALALARNATKTIYIHDTQSHMYTHATMTNSLAGTWRCRGTESGGCPLMQRVA